VSCYDAWAEGSSYFTFIRAQPVLGDPSRNEPPDKKKSKTWLNKAELVRDVSRNGQPKEKSIKLIGRLAGFLLVK